MVTFVDDSADNINNELISIYEGLSGRVLSKADPEALVLSAVAAEISNFSTKVNIVGNQNLVRYSSGVALEEIAAKFGVYRLDASAAVCTIRFNIATGSPTFTIPAGVRVKSTDNKVFFATDAETIVSSGTLTVDIACTCTQTGEIGNNYATGTLINLADLVPGDYVSSVSNIDVTSGGAEDETDDALRERVPLSSGVYSVAGPTDAYAYFAKTASPAIVDVSVDTPEDEAGTVYIYPLLKGGNIPGSTELDLVDAILNDKKVRPVNDAVIVEAPERIEYAIEVNCRIKKSVSSIPTQEAISAKLAAFAQDYTKPLGVDKTIDQITGVVMSVKGLYDCEIVAPSSDIICSKKQFGYCTGINVTVTEIMDEE